MKAIVSEKGQITIPQALRHRLNLKAGQVLEIYEESGRLVARKERVQDPLDKVYGILELPGSVDDFVSSLRDVADEA